MLTSKVGCQLVWVASELKCERVQHGAFTFFLWLKQTRSVGNPFVDMMRSSQCTAALSSWWTGVFKLNRAACTSNISLQPLHLGSFCFSLSCLANLLKFIQRLIIDGNVRLREIIWASRFAGGIILLQKMRNWTISLWCTHTSSSLWQRVLPRGKIQKGLTAMSCCGLIRNGDKASFIPPQQLMGCYIRADCFKIDWHSCQTRRRLIHLKWSAACHIKELDLP